MNVEVHIEEQFTLWSRINLEIFQVNPLSM